MAESLEELVDSIRLSALEPSQWQSVQHLSEAYFGSTACQLSTIDHEKGNLFTSITTHVPEIDAHLQTAAAYSEPISYAIRNPNWRQFCDYDFITEDEIRKSDFYRASDSFGFGYLLVCRLTSSSKATRAISWFWPKSAGHVQAEHFRKLSVIDEHLRLAAHVSETLGNSIKDECRLADALELCGQSAMIVETDGTVLHANSLAERQIRSEDGLSIVNRKLTATHRESRANLQRMIAQKEMESFLEKQNNTVVIHRNSGGDPLFIVGSTLPKQESFFRKRRPAVILFIHSYSKEANIDEDHLRLAFGFTHAEAEIAKFFSANFSLSEIASKRQCSIETVRRQFKSIMAKTDTKRQAETISVLRSLGNISGA